MVYSKRFAIFAVKRQNDKKTALVSTSFQLSGVRIA